MNEITKWALNECAKRYPKAAISFNTQFLGGGPCGFVPADWDGETHLHVLDAWGYQANEQKKIENYKRLKP